MTSTVWPVLLRAAAAALPALVCLYAAVWLLRSTFPHRFIRAALARAGRVGVVVAAGLAVVCLTLTGGDPDAAAIAAAGWLWLTVLFGLSLHALMFAHKSPAHGIDKGPRS